MTKQYNYNFDCRHFTGYKPCKFKRACEGCPSYDRVDQHILIVSLEALGAVLRSTCLLAPIREAYPKAKISWLTMPNAQALLKENPFIDELLLFNLETQVILSERSFDRCFVVDKSPLAGAISRMVKASEKRGFGTDPHGTIIPLNPEADYQYRVGLDDQLKFFDNQKPETQQITESMGLPWNRGEYVLAFSKEEQETIQQRRQELLGKSEGIIGYSTGCSLLYPYKKFTIERSIELIREWRTHFPRHKICLFGGREDGERNRQIAAAFLGDPMVVSTPTDQGLRSGVMWMATADVILSGCSLGLHIAIALKKKVITWFGVSCAQEIDLYDRGVKLKAQVNCSPCWRKSCDKNPKCYDEVPVAQIVEATAQLFLGDR